MVYKYDIEDIESRYQNSDSLNKIFRFPLESNTNSTEPEEEEFQLNKTYIQIPPMF